MHFSRILWNLAKSGEAFLYNMERETFVIVPFGKYAGIWRYRKNSKTTTWSPYTLQHLAPREVRSKSEKVIRFPLPDIVYLLHGNIHPGKLHNQNRKALGYATLAWKKLVGAKIGHLEDLVRQAAAKLKDGVGIEQGAAIACSFAMPHFLRLVESAPDLARDRASQLSKYSTILGAMRPAQRQRFVIRLIQHGIKPAIKKTFTGINPDIVDAILRDGMIPYIAAVIRSRWGTNKIDDFYRTMALANYFTWTPVKRITLEEWSNQ